MASNDRLALHKHQGKGFGSMFASIFYDMLAGLGCASLTLIAFIVAIIALGMRLGWFPELHRSIKRVASPQSAEAGKGGDSHESNDSTK
jgi:hypothetical protein